MKKMNNIKCVLLAVVLAFSGTVTSCGNSDVTVEVPKTYVKLLEIGDYGLGDKDDGYKEKTKNDDDSVTFTFTKKQHKAIMSKLSERMEELISDIDDEDDFTKIITNDDYTNFTFVTDEYEFGLDNGISVLPYLMLAKIYTTFKGDPDINIAYEFVNDATGLVIYSSQTNDKAEEKTESTTAIPVTTVKSTAKPAKTTKKAAKTTAKPKKTTAAKTEKKETKTEPAVQNERTYDHNEYYDLVEQGAYVNSIGYTTIICKVLAKKDVSVSSTVIAYAPDGSVIGKSTDECILTNGKYNYFRYSFSGDMSNATFSYSANAERDSFLVGERNAVEMEQYNKSGNYLYITFKQTGDNVGSFAKYKLLFYKGDKIVKDEFGYLKFYSSNLNGKGSTDVAEIWAYGIDFDRVEFIYEP